MHKKLLFGGLLALAALVTVPMLAAWEAHVINVTAQIENALAVTTEHIDFGTVFPQEHLEQPLDIALSQSFLAEDRVDDVEYFIRQKPKCGVTTLDGRVLVEGSTATGHIRIGDNPGTPTITETHWIDCGEAPVDFNPATHRYDVLPSLCEYISKEGEDQNDETLPSFHIPWTLSTTTGTTTVNWLDVHGRLAKSDQDLTDRWTIDLAVPCFGGHCAQDWEGFVHSFNATATPSDFAQPIENEHKVFGCDLWVEVSGITRNEEPFPPNSLGPWITNLSITPTSGPPDTIVTFSVSAEDPNGIGNIIADIRYPDGVYVLSPNWNFGNATSGTITFSETIDHGILPTELGSYVVERIRAADSFNNVAVYYPDGTVVDSILPTHSLTIPSILIQ
jgi:hypothetical protein